MSNNNKVKYYSLDYNLQAYIDQNKTRRFKVHTLLWSFDLNFILENHNIRLCETENVANIMDSQFRLKFQFENDLFHINYLYPEHDVIEKAVLILQYSSNLMNYGGRRDDTTLVSNKTCKVVANKWQHLYSLKKNSLNSSYDWTIKLKFEFTMQRVPINNNKSLAIVLPPNLLSIDFENLLLESIYSDVILKSADEYEFKVHKAILSSRSTVLKAYFAHDTLENKNNIVESQFDKEVLKEVLTYIYTGKTPKIHEMPDKLLEAGDFYNLPGLKIASEQSLHLKLTKDNAIKTLQLADLHSATSLKQLTLEFIKDGHAGDVTRTEDWKSIKSLELIKTLYEFVTSSM